MSLGRGGARDEHKMGTRDNARSSRGAEGARDHGDGSNGYGSGDGKVGEGGRRPAARGGGYDDRRDERHGGRHTARRDGRRDDGGAPPSSFSSSSSSSSSSAIVDAQSSSSPPRSPGYESREVLLAQRDQAIGLLLKTKGALASMMEERDMLRLENARLAMQAAEARELAKIAMRTQLSRAM